MRQGIIQVDAFTDTPFRGNPAAVCVLAEPADEGWMQRVAMEMNLAETAFLHPEADGFRLRWFTPLAEVDLCGHATLASAHVLWETGQLSPETQARFHTRSGLLTADREGEWIVLDFPATPATPADAPDALTQGLGVPFSFVGMSPFDYLVEVDSEATLRNLQPDLGLIKQLPVRGVIVTSPGDASEYDFVSRFFAPRVGVPEDPVTGSAHCVLTPFWGDRLGKTEMLAYQASARGGVLRVKRAGERIRIGGQAITVLRGEINA